MKPAAKPPTVMLMALATPPLAWQQSMAKRLVAALEQSVRTSPAADDAPGQTLTPSTPWQLPSTDIAQAAQRLSPAAQQTPLYLRCLSHYRDELRAQDQDHDDAGAALACMLAAAAQAIEKHAVTPERWQAVSRWLQRDLMPAVDWSAASATERQDVFARWALLAVALGEWSLEASKRGGVAQQTASLMARQHLVVEFGVDARLLMDAMRWQGLIPATAG